MSELLCKELPDGRHACVIPLTYGRARIVTSFPDEKHYLYADGW